MKGKIETGQVKQSNQIKHVEAPGFFTTNASRCMIAGPMADGQMLLYFQRDSMRIAQDTVTMVAPGTLGIDTLAEDIMTVKEDVAIISMTDADFQVFCRMAASYLAAQQPASTTP